MTPPPKISVVIPTFNRAEMVCDCVASVLATGYPDLAVLVVDNNNHSAGGKVGNGIFNGVKRTAVFFCV